ncbi:MAG TPA: TrbG/VirB9 family P-type conjugative transfer protein [Bryobacteraceae bacterium]|nr:TrbG/VirB9 family P-type conjugative transfer protein [Bryobacteraceae bacterium]
MPYCAITDYVERKDLDAKDAPPLFVLGRRGEAQLVNYRVRRNYYIVDQVIRQAELRLGEAPQQIVTIERQGS